MACAMEGTLVGIQSRDCVVCIEGRLGGLICELGNVLVLPRA